MADEKLRQVISEKIEELTFANYEGNVEGVIIIMVTKGNFTILPAYSNKEHGTLNIGLDIAKEQLMEVVKQSMTEVKRDN